MVEIVDRILLIGISVLVGLPIPLLIIAYYFLRLGLRKQVLAAKIIELHLEPEFLKVFHFSDWEKVRNKSPEEKTSKFEAIFSKQFHGNNSFRNFLLPFLLTTSTTVILALIVYRSLLSINTIAVFFTNSILPLAVAGSILYVFPLYISRYSSFSLNPNSLYELLGNFWVSVVIGIITASVFSSTLQPIAAFLGGFLPIAAMNILRKKIFTQNEDRNSTEELSRESALLEVLHWDRELFSQLNYIGIRSILQLAYENPLKIFVETDLNLVVCIDLVDQANLHLYYPKEQTRNELKKFGIRTATDIMTYLSESFKTSDGNKEYRDLMPDDFIPDHIKIALTEISKTVKLNSMATFVNIIVMMRDNPTLRYISDLWDMVNETVDQSTVPKLGPKGQHVDPDTTIQSTENPAAPVQLIKTPALIAQDTKASAVIGGDKGEVEAALVTYSDAKQGFSIGHPGTWTQDKTVTVGVKFERGDESLTLEFVTLPDGTDIMTYAKNDAKSMQTTFPGYKKIDLKFSSEIQNAIILRFTANGTSTGTGQAFPAQNERYSMPLKDGRIAILTIIRSADHYNHESVRDIALSVKLLK